MSSLIHYKDAKWWGPESTETAVCGLTRDKIGDISARQYHSWNNKADWSITCPDCQRALGIGKPQLSLVEA